MFGYRVRRRIILAGVALVAMSQTAAAQSCKASDSHSASMLIGLRNLADAADTSNVLLRSKLRTPAVPAAEVVLVVDESGCARAREALDSLIHALNPSAPNPLPVRALYVIRVGNVTAVRDPNGRAGEYSPVEFFSPQWLFLGTMLGY